MNIEPVKTALIKEGDDVFATFIKVVKTLEEGSIIAISSKVIALAQKRIINAEKFHETLKKEASQVFFREVCPNIYLTIKDGIFIPNAGMDFSNVGKGKVILWPKNPQKEAENFLERAKKYYRLKKLGVLIVDSSCKPLREGTTGIALACAGFEPVKDKRSQKDLFGRRLKVTKVGVADALSVAACLVMGEANEKTPFAVIKNFKADFVSKKNQAAKMRISPEKCLFQELYRNKSMW